MKAFLSLCAMLLVSNGALAADESLTLRQQEGKKLFDATCNYCHNSKGWATERLKLRMTESQAVIAERNDLDRNYMRFVVRNGLVNMPAFTPTDLTDAQIQVVVDYLTRKNVAINSVAK